MKISRKGIELVKKHEGYSSKPYLCPAKVPTIGYGNTFYPDGTKVSMSDKPLSKDMADLLLTLVLKDFEDCVNKIIKSDINQNQFDALVSFAYNLGCGNLKKSTLAKKINANPCDITISNEFAKWDKAGGKRLRGLTIRRHDEAVLYFTDI